MTLSAYVGTLNALGDESRLRLCALLRSRELCVTDLVRVTGMAQSRVSTHLGRLKDAGFVRDRKNGTQCFYALAEDTLPPAAKAVLDGASTAEDPTLVGDQRRLLELEAERRAGLPDWAADNLERYYSPGRTWQSLAAGIAGLLELGDVLDVGSGDGAAAAVIAPYVRSLTCVDSSVRMIDAARVRLAKFENVRVLVADAQELPFEDAAFDATLVFHTLTYAAHPKRLLAECARVLRPGGRLVLLCLDRHEQHEITARYGELHPGFAPDAVKRVVAATGLVVKSAQVVSREPKKPHLDVVLAIAQKPKAPPR
jgi:ArsR family transcriptional regulator